jgi:hypothetical protein
MGNAWVADSEQKVWIDSETFDWEQHPSKLKASDFGDGQSFVVDYCRVWQRTRPDTSCEPQSNLIVNPGFETGERSWQGAAAVSDDKHSGRRAAILKTGGTIEQTIDVKPNTTYVLSAWAKSPNTNEKDRWFNAFLGVKEYGNAPVNARFFFSYYQQRSVQFTTGGADTTAVVYFTNKPHGEPAIVDDVQLVEVSQ